MTNSNGLITVPVSIQDVRSVLEMQYNVTALASVIIVARKVVSHDKQIQLLKTCVKASEKENEDLRIKLKVA